MVGQTNRQTNRDYNFILMKKCSFTAWLLCVPLQKLSVTRACSLIDPFFSFYQIYLVFSCNFALVIYINWYFNHFLLGRIQEFVWGGNFFYILWEMGLNLPPPPLIFCITFPFTYLFSVFFSANHLILVFFFLF